MNFGYYKQSYDIENMQNFVTDLKRNACTYNIFQSSKLLKTFKFMTSYDFPNFQLKVCFEVFRFKYFYHTNISLFFLLSCS